MTTHETGTREEWRAARLELLKAEKDFTRRGDELTRRRQDLPWVRIDKEYRFENDRGSVSLEDLFRGRSKTASSTTPTPPTSADSIRSSASTPGSTAHRWDAMRPEAWPVASGTDTTIDTRNGPTPNRVTWHPGAVAVVCESAGSGAIAPWTSRPPGSRRCAAARVLGSVRGSR